MRVIEYEVNIDDPQIECLTECPYIEDSGIMVASHTCAHCPNHCGDSLRARIMMCKADEA